MDFKTLRDIELSFFIRFIHSLNFYFSWLILISLLFKKYPSKLASTFNKMVILIVANLPIAIQLSTSEIHMDQSFGILSAACLIWAVISFDGSRMSHVCLFVSSIVLNLGKNEWSFCFFAGILCLSAYLLALRLLNDKKVAWSFIGILLLGFAIGNSISYFYDPANYLSGLDLMLDSAYKTTFASYLPRIDILPDRFIHLSDREFNHRDFGAAFAGRIEYIAPLLICILISLISLAINPSFLNRTHEFFALVLGFLLFFAFFVSTHSESVRYFALAYILLAYFFIQAGFTFPQYSGKYITLGFSILFIFATLREISLQVNLRNNNTVEFFEGVNPALDLTIPPTECIRFYSTPIFNRNHDYLVDWGKGAGYELARIHKLKTCN